MIEKIVSGGQTGADIAALDGGESAAWLHGKSKAENLKLAPYISRRWVRRIDSFHEPYIIRDF